MPPQISLPGKDLALPRAKIAEEGAHRATQQIPETALSDYAERWEIETLFGSLKSRGFKFEATRMTEYDRIEKLLAFLAIAFSWAHITGEWFHARKPIEVKKHGRIAKSIFRYGLDHLRHCLRAHSQILGDQ